MGLGIYVYDAHVVNTVSLIMTDVMYQEVYLLFSGLWRRCVVLIGQTCGPGRLSLMPLQGGEYFAGQVREPVQKLVMMRRDKAAPLRIEGVANIRRGYLAIP